MLYSVGIQVYIGKLTPSTPSIKEEGVYFRLCFLLDMF